MADLVDELRQKAEIRLWNKYQDRRKEDLKTVMMTEAGRRFLATLFKVTNFRGSVKNANGSEKDWQLGRQSVSCDIFNEIKSPKYSDELYPLYQKLEQEDIADAVFLESEIQKEVAQFREKR